MRPDGRLPNQLRNITITPGVSQYAEGSCLVKFGNTHVLCTASLDDGAPPFLRNKGKGWVTAEYGMLPRSTHSRMKREAASGKQSGRTQEIQRLIGRSLRAVTDLTLLGERQILVDCDVIQADGGTRTASTTGAYVALHLAFEQLIRRRLIVKNPLIAQLAAISCGIFENEVILDLDYAEDSRADVDANFVMSDGGSIIEVQGTAEGSPFNQAQLIEMLNLAQNGINELMKLQLKVLKGES